MLSMGFSKELSEVLLATSPHRQTLCFSATYPASVEHALTLWLARTKPVVRIVVGAPPVPTTSTSATSSSSTSTTSSSSGSSSSAAASDASAATTSSLAASSLSMTGGAAAGDGGANGLLLVSPNVSQIVQCCASHKKPRKLLKFLSELKQREDRERVRHKTSVLVFVNKIKTYVCVGFELGVICSDGLVRCIG
jgi:superfamily II DNA/RNA helicase